MVVHPTPARPGLRSLALATLLVALSLGGCSGGGGSGIAPPDPVGFAGSWNLTIVPDATGGCAGRTQTLQTYRIEITQSGLEIDIADVTGLQFTGTAASPGLVLSGRYPIDGSFADLPNLQLRLESDGTLAGSGDWTQLVGGTPCSGTDLFRAVRIPPLDDLAGVWDLNERVLDSSCTLTTPNFRDVWTLTQVGNRVTVTRQGSGSQASGQVEASGRLVLDFDYVDPTAGRIVETFFIEFLVDRAPPGLTAVSEWSLPGCAGRSEHSGLRTSR